MAKIPKINDQEPSPRSRIVRNRKRVYGWRPQLPDVRDHIFTLKVKVPPVLPDRVDLRPDFPPCYDQGRIGSCTSNAIAGALQYLRKKLGKPEDFTSSRLFNYWNERDLEKSVPYDAGAFIRDGIKVINTFGAPPEHKWQYSDVPADYYTNKWKSGAKPRKRPSDSAYAAGKLKEAVAYEVVPQDVTTLRTCLSEGFPIVFGFSVYDSFETDAVAQTGVVPMPKLTENLLGGHACVIVGYDHFVQRFIVRNSWGTTWGMDDRNGKKGYFSMPYEYVTNRGLAADFWTIRLSE